MAWLLKQKRKERKSRRKKTYYTLQWREEDGRIRSRSLGFCSAAEAKAAVKVIEGRQAAGLPVEPENGIVSSLIMLGTAGALSDIELTTSPDGALTYSPEAGFVGAHFVIHLPAQESSH